MIKKAVIPAAGFGTRFLPASKSQPKEMLPIVDTPTIQYVVEEAVKSGITDILMVIGKGKRAIEEHFDRNFELEAELAGKKKIKEMESVKKISDMANIHFVWQKELKGLGDAIYCAKCHVGNEPFAVMLGDTILGSRSPVTRQLIKVFNRYQESVVVLEEVAKSKVSRYGIMDGHLIEDQVYLVKDFVEKPAVKKAPSNLAIAGRYIFTPEIFSYIEKTKPGKNGEIQITDAMRMMVNDRAMYGLRFNGKRYDIGNKLDFLKTNIEFALKRSDMKKDLTAYLKEMVNEI
ncbi:MAG: UTP--glucose-1-phosphate uridylyltransferase GalU [Planctomycetota bacterium]|jgi:UTP--glucose-1-phosphate uridylyltransferase